jgi:hypothetical protein
MGRRARRKVIVAAMAFVVAGLAACGGRGTVQSNGPAAPQVPAGLLAQLPALPPGKAGAAAGRAASQAQVAFISGTGIYSSSGGIHVQGNSLLLPSKPGSVEYGIYALNIGTDAVTSLETSITAQSGEAYIAVSDYGKGSWRFIGVSGTAADYDLPAGTYTNGSGQFFLLVLTWNGASALHNFSLLRYDDGNPQGPLISGTVLDENSQPLPGAHIGVSPGALDAYTDKDGKYSIGVPGDDTYTLTPDADGFSFDPPTKDVTITGGADSAGNDFTGTSLDIRGTVLAAGQGVAGVRMKLLSSGRITSTLADGTYEFQGVAPGMDTVEPKLAGYTFNPGTSDVNVVASDVTGVDFTATGGQPTFRVSGTVTDAVTSDPLPNVTVRLLPDYVYTQTDATGTYQFTGLAPDEYHVSAFNSDYKITPDDQQAVVINQNADGINFTAQKLYALSGSIKGGGGAFALAGISITLTPGNVTLTTGSDGTYSYNRLLPGSYTLTPSSPLYTFAPLSKMVTLGNADLAAPDFTGTLGTVTYTNAIALIVSNHCLSCHQPSGNPPADPDLRTYADLQTWGALANTDVQGSTMPPGHPLSDQLKEQFQAWVTGGKQQ